MNVLNAMFEWTTLFFRLDGKNAHPLVWPLVLLFNTALRGASIYGLIWIVCRALRDSGVIT
jgi:hypothetical protein